MPEIPIGAHWNPGLPAFAPQQIPCAAPDPRPPQRVPQKVRAYVRDQAGQTRLLVVAAKPPAPPLRDLRSAPLPPLPAPPRASGALGGRFAPSPISQYPASGGNAPARGADIIPPPPPPASGCNAFACGLGGPLPSRLPAGGCHAPASGSNAGVFVPPLPVGPPPRRSPPVSVLNVSGVAPASDPVGTRRAFTSVDTLGTIGRFSRSLDTDVGNALVRTVDTVARSEIASTIDEDESVPIVDDTMETNLNVYLQAVCAGDGRPMGSHPMRMAKALVLGALRDRQSDFQNVGLVVASFPDTGSVRESQRTREAMA